MGLHGHRHERLSRRNVHDRRTRALEVLEGGAAGIEGAEKIYIDHCLESVGRHAECWRRKVSRRSTDDDIDLAEFLTGGRDSRGKSIVIADVCRKPLGATSGIFDAAGRGVKLRLSSPDKGDAGAVFRESFGNCEVDSATPAGDERDFSFENPLAEYFNHLRSV